jgi:hypothetical protein
MSKKTIIVKVHKNRPVGGPTTFAWPAAWIRAADAYQANPVAFEDTGQIGSNVIERVLAVVDDSVYDDMIADKDIEPVDLNTAQMLGSRWKADTPVIANIQEIARILRKVKDGQRLTDAEVALIDEDNAAAGGIIKKTFNIYDYIG